LKFRRGGRKTVKKDNYQDLQNGGSENGCAGVKDDKMGVLAFSKSRRGREGGTMCLEHGETKTPNSSGPVGGADHNWDFKAPVGKRRGGG